MAAQSISPLEGFVKKLRGNCNTEDAFLYRYGSEIERTIIESAKRANPNIRLELQNLTREEGMLRIDDIIVESDEWTYNLVRGKTPILVAQIFDDWDTLRAVFSEHAGQIQRMWKDKSVRSRKEALLGAWPGMSAKHSPDFEALRRGLKGVEPQINVEDLSKPHNLVLFMESRSQESPESFAWADSASIDMAQDSGVLEPLECLRYTMLLTGQSDRQSYGSILSWVDEEDSRTHFLRGTGFSLGIGLRVLENQSKLYHFLVRCTEILLTTSERSFSSLVVSAKSRLSCTITKPAKVPVTNSSTLEWGLVAKINNEAAYRLPEHSALDRLGQLVSVRCEEAKDDFWALYEDPAFFRNVVEEHRLQIAHQLDLYVSHNVIDRRRLSRYPVAEFSSVTGSAIFRRCRAIIVWRMLFTDLEELEEPKKSANIQPLQPLPREFEEALINFKFMAMALNKIVKDAFFETLVAMPAFKKYFTMTKFSDASYGSKLIKATSVPPLLNLLEDIFHPIKASMVGATNVFNEVERMERTHASQRALITPFLARSLSEMAAFGEIVDALGRHQPRLRAIEDQVEAATRVAKRFDMAKDIQQILNTPISDNLIQQSSAPEYVLNHKNTKLGVEKRRTAEASLDSMWQKIDEHFVKEGGKTLISMMGDRLSLREVERTPPWQPPLEMTFSEFPLSITDPSSPTTSAFDPILHDVRVNRRSSLAPEQTPKVKTHALADPAKETDQAVAVAKSPQQLCHPQVFRVSGKTLKTMNTLFPTTEQEHTTRKVPWNEFRSALSKLDFSVKSMDGSAWYFEPSWKPEAPITFHEPHPSSEIPPVTLGFFASRLARKYGWSSENFQLA